jgi:hypothetical protein
MILSRTAKKNEGYCRQCRVEPARAARRAQETRVGGIILVVGGILGLLTSIGLFFGGQLLGYIAVFYGLAIVSVGAILQGIYMLVFGRGM